MASIIINHIEIVTNEIRKSKKLQIDKLSDKLRNNTNGLKYWWKTLKTFIKLKQTSFIPPLIVGGHIYPDSTDKANVPMTTFLDKHHLTIPMHLLHLPDNILDSITVTPHAVESILSYLQLGRAAGPDVINNIILKELKDVLSALSQDRTIHQMQLITGLFHF